MSNFWIGFIIGGFICGIIGFLSAAILAASSKGSRMEETLVLKSKDMPPWKLCDATPFDDEKDTYGIVSKMGKVKNHFRKPEIETVKQNDPRTD